MPAQDGSKIANPGELELAAKHLGLAVDCLEKALLFHSYGTRSVVYIPYKPSEAAQARDAFAKSLYAGETPPVCSALHDPGRLVGPLLVCTRASLAVDEGAVD